MSASHAEDADASHRLADRLAIEALNADFAFHLDRNNAAAVLALFTADALYVNGARRTAGHAEIEAFLRGRNAAGPRTTRHMCSGLRIAFDAAQPDVARGTAVWINYAHNGTPPIDAITPFLIADFDDVYRRGADGRWRIAERIITPVFRNPAVPPPGAAPVSGAAR